MMVAVQESGSSSLAQLQIICGVALSTGKMSPSVSHCVFSFTGHCFCRIFMGFVRKKNKRRLEGKPGTTWPVMMTPGKR